MVAWAMVRTPSLDALRIFVVAARHLSFTEAASELNLTQSAVSHRIRGLEEELGLPLFKRLPRIRDRHPNIDVQVIADPRLLDLRAEGIDLAIRFCRVPHSGYAATRLMGDRVFPVCAPGLIKQNRKIDSIDSLLALPLLHDSATDRDGSDSDWRAWLDYHGRP